MKPLDLQHIRAFVAIAREGNLTRAAERLNLTQSAVSLQIKSLQETLDVPLFERTARGLALSPQGRVLLLSADKLLGASEDMVRAAEGLKAAVHGKLGLGTILNPESIRLGATLQYLVEKHPAIQTKLRHGMSGWVLRQIRRGELDAGFYLGEAEDEASGGEFLRLRLMPVRYFVIAPKGWNERVRNRGWAQIAALPWVWTPPDSAHHRMLSRKFGGLGVQPGVVAEVDLEASMLNLVKSGVGLSLARDSIALRAAQDDGVIVLQRLTLPAEMSFVALRARQDDPVVRAAVAAVQSVFE